MIARLIQFAKRDEGVVTVDWVVLTAGLVTLALVIMLLMQDVLPAHLGEVLADAADYMMPN